MLAQIGVENYDTQHDWLFYYGKSNILTVKYDFLLENFYYWAMTYDFTFQFMVQFFFSLIVLFWIEITVSIYKLTLV